jgi:polyphosphate kinase 2 (PPK2 family)
MEDMAHHRSRLAEVDLSLRLSAEEETEQLAAAQRRILHLRLVNGGQLGDGRLGPPVCVVFEGWDASGKGGSIKRLVAPLDPRHVRVAQFSAPDADGLRHHFLWRFYPSLPGWGGMAVFDRSWYGRVLVERVEKLATEEQWRRAYEEIRQFEWSLAEEGMVLIKIWTHISPEEQLKRFEARQADPLKRWKLTDDDWRNREKWSQYEEAVEDMLEFTDHPNARWHVLPTEQKRYGRVAVLRMVIARMEEGMRRWGIEPPPSTGADYDGAD